MSLLICLACAVLAVSNLARFLATGKWLYPMWVSGAVVAVAFLGLLAGCTSRVTTPEGDALGTTTYNIRGQYTVHEFHLKDGTRCVASYQGGVACDWRGPRPGVPGNFRVE